MSFTEGIPCTYRLTEQTRMRVEGETVLSGYYISIALSFLLHTPHETEKLSI